MEGLITVMCKSFKYLSLANHVWQDRMEQDESEGHYHYTPKEEMQAILAGDKEQTSE